MSAEPWLGQGGAEIERSNHAVACCSLAKASSGLKLCTNILSEKEVLLLCNILRRKFNLKANIHSDRNQYVIYIPKSSIQNLTRIVGSHIHPSMKYKLNGYL